MVDGIEVAGVIQQSMAPAKKGIKPANPKMRAGVGMLEKLSMGVLDHQILIFERVWLLGQCSITIGYSAIVSRL